MRPAHGIMSSGGDLSLASLVVHHDVKDKAAIGPAGAVEPSYDLRKAMLMSCTYPHSHPSYIHSFISFHSHM